MKDNFLCCKDCRDRHIGCHADCSRYLQAKEEREKKRQIIRQEKDLEIYHDVQKK